MFTVLGASGFVGSHLVEHFKKEGIDYYAPTKDDQKSFSFVERPLGHVIYCIGLTADFRQHPLETAEAHVSLLVQYLKKTEFDSFLYLSSTRIYEGSDQTDELATLTVNPLDPNHIFNLTKLAGEACCLSQKRASIRIARLSNVLGNDFKSENFIFSVMREIAKTSHVTLHTTADSAKDYIHIDDVVRLIIHIAERGKDRIYNLASGKNMSNQVLLDKIVKLSGGKVRYADDMKQIRFLPIQTDRIRSEFLFKPKDIEETIEKLYHDFCIYLNQQSGEN